MLSRSHRFHGHSSLSWVYRSGKSVRESRLALRYGLNTRRHSYRAAVVVSRKVSKSAVVRNRIRRRIYEIIRNQPINQPFDLIFSVYSDELAALPHPELVKAICSLLTQAQVISPSKPEAGIVNNKELS